MGKTSSIREEKHDEASNKDTIKTYDNHDVVGWSDLNHDVLFLVMKQLGAVDFLTFSLVCKSWRSLALINRKSFMVSKPPMSVHVSNDANEKKYYLEDLEGRKFKTILPHSAGRKCIGVTSGYLILLGEETGDFWLVNLITRHELHFPDFPDELFCCPGNVRAFIVFSSSLSGWVFVVKSLCYEKTWFSIEGKRKWIEVSNPFGILDLHVFMGKIYALQYINSCQMRLCEMRLYPKPKYVLLKTMSFPIAYFSGFVSCGEKLYVINRSSEHPYEIHEIDFDEMKVVSREKIGQDYAFFLRNSMYYDYIPDWCVDLSSQYGRCVVTDKSGKGRVFRASMWYCFHDCLYANANLVHES